MPRINRPANIYLQKRMRPKVAPALVVATDKFKGPAGEFRSTVPLAQIQEAVIRQAKRIAPFVSVLHIDLNCGDYEKVNQPDNRQVFSPDFLAGLGAALHPRRPILFDLHVLGRDLYGMAQAYAGVVGHISFELGVATEQPDDFSRAAALLKSNEVSLGLIGAEEPTEIYLPYFSRVDVLGITAGKIGAHSTVGSQYDLPAATQKVIALRKAGFRGRIVFQQGVEPASIPQLVKSGADVLVCGTYIFNNPSFDPPEKALQELNRILRAKK